MKASTDSIMMSKMHSEKLKKVKLSLEKFFYSQGSNVHFRNATLNPRYKEFREKVEKGIKKQVKSVATESKVAHIGTSNNPKETITTYFKTFDEVVSDILSFLIWAANQGGNAGLEKLRLALGVKRVEKQLEIVGVFDLKNEEVIQFLRNRNNLLINSVDNTTKNWISAIVSEGLDEGLSNFEISELLETNSIDMGARRAQLIAETETINAMAQTEHQFYIRNGFQLHNFLTSFDDRVCPICMDAEDGNPYPVGETLPPLHPLCRCYSEVIVPDDFSFISWLGE